MQKFKIRAIIGLVLIYIAILLNWQWMWGLLFLLWAIPDLFSGITYFMGPIEKKSNPVLYWSIVLSWIWMSVYMVLMPFFPQLNIQFNKTDRTTKDIGIYRDVPIKPKELILANHDLRQKSLISNPKNDWHKKKDDTRHSISKDTLKYKSYTQKGTNYFVGISAPFNANDPNLQSQTKQLWEYFYQNDISKVISNIIDERIFFIYSNEDSEGNYKATIAYRTKEVSNVYEGLESVIIPPTKFAIFEQNQNDSNNFIIDTWAKIFDSDLNTSEGFNMEVYEFDETFKVKNSEIRIAIK